MNIEQTRPAADGWGNIRAGVVQRQNASFPSLRRGFDSHHPLMSVTGDLQPGRLIDECPRQPKTPGQHAGQCTNAERFRGVVTSEQQIDTEFEG